MNRRIETCPIENCEKDPIAMAIFRVAVAKPNHPSDWLGYSAADRLIIAIALIDPAEGFNYLRALRSSRSGRNWSLLNSFLHGCQLTCLRLSSLNGKSLQIRELDLGGSNVGICAETHDV